MKVLLDMDEQRFHELFARNELPGKFCGSEKNLTLGTMLTDEQIWNRVQKNELLSADEIEQVHEYGLDEFLDIVIQRINHDFDPDEHYSLSSIVEDVVYDVFTEYCVDTKLDERSVNEISLDGLRTALRRYDETGKQGKCGPWTIHDGRYDLSWMLCYEGKPLVGCYNAGSSGNLEKECSISDSTFTKICDIVSSAFPECRIAPDIQARINENNQSLNR